MHTFVAATLPEPDGSPVPETDDRVYYMFSFKSLLANGSCDEESRLRDEQAPYSKDNTWYMIDVFM